MHHPTYMPPSSAIGIILAASAISGWTDLGELPESVVRWMALPERVTKVQATNQVMFHWAAKQAAGSAGDMRADTATYQWVSKAIRAVVAHPYAGSLGNKGDRTYQIVGEVEPHHLYPAKRWLRLILKFVRSTDSGSGNPEILLDTYIHQQDDSFTGNWAIVSL